MRAMEMLHSESLQHKNSHSLWEELSSLLLQESILCRVNFKSHRQVMTISQTWALSSNQSRFFTRQRMSRSIKWPMMVLTTTSECTSVKSKRLLQKRLMFPKELSYSAWLYCLKSCSPTSDYVLWLLVCMYWVNWAKLSSTRRVSHSCLLL
jgi:hypothetical protein